MIRGYTFIPSIWPSILTAVLLVGLCAYSARRRSIPGALPFAVACLFGTLWVVGAAMEQAATDVGTKVFWVKFQAPWHLPAATAITCFILEYAWPGRWLSRRNAALISVPSLLVLLSVLTNDLHHLFWRGFRFDGAAIPLAGPVSWGVVVAIYISGVTNVVLLGTLFARSPQHRWPVAIIVAGQMGARFLYTVEAANPLRSVVPLDVITLGSLLVVYAVALFGFAMFDPIPLARRTVMAQMRDGVLVLDRHGRIASLNVAAQEIVGVPEKQAIGRPAQDLVPSSATLLADLQPGESGQTEVRLQKDQVTRDYLLQASPLTDWRGLAIGRLLLFHDVTEERRAQAEALQRQWAEATLQERGLLAQELHDGLAQNLGFLNLQAQAAQIHLRRGENEAADDSLNRLTEIARTVQEDARQLIGNLLTVSLPSEGFCDTLRGAVTRFEEQTGLPVRLAIDEGAQSACSPTALPATAGVQLLRIVQEALANVWKHAGSPTDVSVALRADDGQMRLIIADNGNGFVPGAVGDSDSHFGLAVMRQRVERIDGKLSVRSAPQEGTSVEVRVPLGDAGNA
jgi:PAS domain S-box-containing protein